MERKKKNFVVRNPRVAWETFQELIVDDENITVEELDDELRANGIDPDETVKKLFELALRVSRQSQLGGRVSPHISDILTQLAAKYYHVEDGSKRDSDLSQSRPRRSGSNNRRHLGETTPAATVQSFHRNFKEESSNDREIREGNERRLLERAAKLKQKKKPARKK